MAYCRQGLHADASGPRCMECRRASARLWRHNNREHYNARQSVLHSKTGRYAKRAKYESQRLYMLRQVGGKCERCGYAENPSILQFDHIVPLNNRKAQRFSSVLGLDITNPLLWDEFQKVQVLCPNCHATKTQKENYDKAWSHECRP